MKLSIHKVSAWTAFVVACAAIPAAAQTLPEPTVDLSLGYEALHIPGQTYPFGIAVGISGALNDMVRIVGEAGVSIARQTTSTYGSGTLKMYHYGVGPRFTATTGRVLLYGQVLAGGVHTLADLTTTSGPPFIDSDNAFMLQPGGGVIIPFTRTFAAMAEVDYRRSFFKQGGDNETRVSAGVRIAFR